MSDGILYERLRQEDLAALRDFCRDNWPGEHPLVHNSDMFEYYYRDADGGINFAVARDEASRALYSVCGYIKASAAPAPDVWISYILTQKGAPLNIGFRLLEKVRELTNCRTIACNNIRKKTRGLYEFLGWTVGDMTQYYRFNAGKNEYTICNIVDRNIQLVSESDLVFESVTTNQQLEAFDFEAFSQNQPYKDLAYAQKRYLHNPWLDYELYTAREPDGAPGALLALRAVGHGGAVALRVVDYIGRRDWIGQWGGFLDRLIKTRGADFCDWFAWGLSDAELLRAGFVPLVPGGENVIPFYLSPPVMENVTLTCFTSAAAEDGYIMFRADGDQDRPNLG